MAFEDMREIPIEKAEHLHGSRLDRRRKYAIVDSQLANLANFSTVCSGCSSDTGEVGRGCRECGYSGRRRISMWVPLVDLDK